MGGPPWPPLLRGSASIEGGAATEDRPYRSALNRYRNLCYKSLVWRRHDEKNRPAEYRGAVFDWIATTNFVSKAGSAPSKAEDDFQLVKVAEGIYAAIAKPGGLASGNAGFIVGDGGVLIVDTFFTPAAIEELIGEIATQTKQPIKYAVNTHYHLDHTGGNQVLAARGVPIIAHDNVMAWQTTKNTSLPARARGLAKTKSRCRKQLSETPADQKDKRTTLERQLDASMRCSRSS